MKLLICTPSYYKNGKIAVSPKLAFSLFEQITSCTWEWYIATEDCTSNENIVKVNQNIAYKLNKGRKLALAQDFDAMFWLPDDHILSAGVIEEMVRFLPKHRIVSAPVRLRPTGMGSPTMSHVGLMSYVSHKDTPANPVGVGKPCVFADFGHLNEWYKRLKWEAPFEVAGGGLPMISREVLEKVTFRQEDEALADSTCGADLRFFSDAYRLGYKTLIVPVQVGHIDQGIEYWLNEEFYSEIINKNILGEIINEYILQGKDLWNKEEEQIDQPKVS
jgi:hypothetical protein